MHLCVCVDVYVVPSRWSEKKEGESLLRMGWSEKTPLTGHTNSSNGRN